MKPVIVEQLLNNNPETVWKAITEPDQMRSWFFENIPSFKPEIEFVIRFNVKAPSRDFLHIWTIKESHPPKSLTYGWRYDGIEGDSEVNFSLSEKNGNTLLTLTHIVTEDFPDQYPEFSYESGVAGWQYFINQRLPEYLEKNYPS